MIMFLMIWSYLYLNLCIFVLFTFVLLTWWPGGHTRPHLPQPWIVELFASHIIAFSLKPINWRLHIRFLWWFLCTSIIFYLSCWYHFVVAKILFWVLNSHLQIGFKFFLEGSMTALSQYLARLVFASPELVSENLQSSDALWLHGASFLVKTAGWIWFMT